MCKKTAFIKPRATQTENLRGFFSLSLNEQATKAKKQKKVAKKKITLLPKLAVFLLMMVYPPFHC